MGRQRTFIESEAISSTTAVFAECGLTGVSVDDPVRATGISRTSLYGVLGSKDRLFQHCPTETLAALNTVATLGDSADVTGAGRGDPNLILVAFMEIVPRDPAVHGFLKVILNRAGVTAETLGRRLLAQASATTSGSTPSAPAASALPPT